MKDWLKNEWEIFKHSVHPESGQMKGDFTAFFVVPLIFMALTFITAVLIVAYAQASVVLNQTMTQFNVNSTYQNIPTQIANNYYNFNFWLPFIFYFCMLAVIMSSVWLTEDAMSWLIGVIYIPFIYYISVYISNISHAILMAPQITNGIAHLPLPLATLANLPTITFLFALIYIVSLALRIWFFPVGGGQRR